jgi:transposase, IS5 family
LIDATCAPADIRYPTDLSLLNESREKLEEIIDVLHKPLKGKKKKCRTYRQKARYEYLQIAKKRRVNAKEIRKGIRKQLGYVKRNLGHIVHLLHESPLKLLSKRQYRDLLVIHELYRQQRWMYENNTHSIEGRIVSISQPHIRPIVRGKVSAPVEFGAKISVSVVDGWVFLDRLSWEPYHEAKDLKGQVENYRERFGYYPESVHGDKTYRNRENRAYCKSHNIRLSGPPLGRRKKDPDEVRREKALVRQDERDRIPVEGKFGNGKRRYGLDRIMAKRDKTSESTIGTIILVMNLEKILRYFLFVFLYMAYRRKKKHYNFKVEYNLRESNNFPAH